MTGRWSFDDSQREAVEDRGRLVAIEGPPGSGRTSVLLGRCRRLLDGGAVASSVQVLVDSRRAVQAARAELGALAECRVETVPDFSAQLLRRLDGAGFSLLSDREAMEMLGRRVRFGWREQGADSGDGGVRDWVRSERLLAMLSGRCDGGSAMEAYREECRERRLWDRWSVVEGAADALAGSPTLASALRGGPCRWLLADDVHRWGQAERRLLDALSGEPASVTLCGDEGQRVGEGEDVLKWWVRTWKDEVSVRRLRFCHRSAGAICDVLSSLGGQELDWFRPWGESVQWVTGDTARESEAIAAEVVGEWVANGVAPGHVAVVDLSGGGGRDGMALQLRRVGLVPGLGIGDGEIQGDAEDGAALLRLALNPRDVSALQSTWRRQGGRPVRVERGLVVPVIEESGAWESDLMSGAGWMLRSGGRGARATWLRDLYGAWEGMRAALESGVGGADVLDWRRRRVFDPWEPASEAFGELARAVGDVESAVTGVVGIAGFLDRLSLGGCGAGCGRGGEVEVVGVSEVIGREWRAVCVVNAVGSPEGGDLERRTRELYVAGGRARDLLAVCDYWRDHRRRPAVRLLG